MGKKVIIILCILTVMFSSLQAQDDIEQSFLNVFHSISSHDIRDYVVEMSADKYRGRLTGSPEFILVAQWVADNLKAWGLEPCGDGGTYYQWFDKPYVEVKNSGNLTLQASFDDGSTIEKHYIFPDDYFPGTNSDNGIVTGEVVYVGHGMTAPELGYDDYGGIDVNGKIVLVDTDVPVNRNHEAYADWVPYTYHQHKLDNAAKHGAAGMLYINKSANPNTSYNQGLIYCHVDPEFAKDIFFGTGKSYEEVKGVIQNTLKPASFSTGKKVTITANTEYHPEGRGCNVLGLVEGTDPILKDEVIIVGGHLDGVGDLGKIMPGALDNASGVANMLAAAKALAASPVKLKRSVLFIFIGGEECGLFGSKLYCKEPKFPKEKTICYFNLDMVGVGSGIRVGGSLSYPHINRCFEEANNNYIHRPFRSSEAWKAGVGRPRSDSVIFNRAGYRTLSFGTFRQEGEPRSRIYYHHPLDTVDTLSPEIMEDVAKLMFVGLTNMANAEILID